MVDTPLVIVGGLPYNRRVRILKAAITWPSLDDFEVRSQIRETFDKRSKLLGTLTPFITPSIEGEDIVLDLRITGSDTRALSGGYYDIVVSDPDSADDRAIRALGGRLQVSYLATGV